MNNQTSFCPYCGTPYDPAAGLPCCVNCAKPLPKGETTTVSCPTCGAPIPSGLQSCPACGALFMPDADDIYIPEPPVLTAQIPDLPDLPEISDLPDSGEMTAAAVVSADPAPAAPPAQEIPVQVNPVKEIPVQPIPVREIPVQEIPVRSSIPVEYPNFQSAASVSTQKNTKTAKIITICVGVITAAVFVIICAVSAALDDSSTHTSGGREVTTVTKVDDDDDDVVVDDEDDEDDDGGDYIDSLRGDDKTAFEYIIASKEEFTYPESIRIIGGSIASDDACLFSNIRYKNSDGETVEELYYFDQNGWCLPQEEDIYEFYKYTDKLDLDAINDALEEYYS